MNGALEFYWVEVYWMGQCCSWGWRNLKEQAGGPMRGHGTPTEGGKLLRRGWSSGRAWVELSRGEWGNGLWAETQGYKLGGAMSPVRGEQRSTAASVEPQVSQPFHPDGPLHLPPRTSAAPSLPGLTGTRVGDWVLPIFQMRMLRPQVAHGARAHAQDGAVPPRPGDLTAPVTHRPDHSRAKQAETRPGACSQPRADDTDLEGPQAPPRACKRISAPSKLKLTSPGKPHRMCAPGAAELRGGVRCEVRFEVCRRSGSPPTLSPAPGAQSKAWWHLPVVPAAREAEATELAESLERLEAAVNHDRVIARQPG
ncbi:uncharacterized protein LOC106997327 isoform X1 [Macaca mulatta]